MTYQQQANLTNTAAKISQTIHEARGLCWHEADPKYLDECLKCGEDILDEWNFAIVPNPDYTSDWSAWGAALEWAQGKEWWGEFAQTFVCRRHTLEGVEEILLVAGILLSTYAGSTALTKFIDKHSHCKLLDGDCNNCNGSFLSCEHVQKKEVGR